MWSSESQADKHSGIHRQDGRQKRQRAGDPEGFASPFNYLYLDNTNGGCRKMIKLALGQVYVM